jgi:Carbohydrate-selective porin, OprB family
LPGLTLKSKYTLGVRKIQHMLKFKAGMFSWSILTITVFCTAPAFAQVQAPSQDAAAQNVTPVDPAASAEAKNKGDAQAPKTGSLELSDSNVQFLKSFNDRHKCGIANIDAAISRADFANNIVVCLTSTEVKLAQDPNAIPASELAQLRDVVDQFSNEVSYLGNRLETVEKKVASIQKASSFSTTTKLAGEVIVALTGNSSQTGAGDTNRGGLTFADRVRINLDTTFSGKDRLRTRLQSRNLTSLNAAGGTGTNTTRLGFDGNDSGGSGNTTSVSLLQYTLPIFNGSRLIVETVGSEFNENLYTFNPQLTSSGSGAISRFGRYNPVYRQSNDGAAATADFRLSPEFSFGVGYAIPNGANTGGVVTSANDPGVNSGVLGGNYAGIAQLRYQPSPDLDLGLVYSRSYHNNGNNVSGSTGSAFANNPFNGAPTVANHYNFLASSKLSPGFTLSGWVGLTNANIESGGSTSGSADIFNGSISAAFSDVGAKGNVLGFIVGVPPRVTSISSSVAGNRTRNNPDTTLHLETLYKIKVSDNLDITPGVLLITNPESVPGAASKGSEFVGTVRTTFKF